MSKRSSQAWPPGWISLCAGLSANAKLSAFSAIIDRGDCPQAPDNARYKARDFNRRNSYGLKSIDYSTTE